MRSREQEKLEEASKKVRENATPAQRSIMEQVDAAFDEEVNDFNARREAEDNLRSWAENLTGIQLDMSEIEELRTKALGLSSGSILTFRAKRGTVQIYKTVFNTLDRVDRYLNTLERTVIDITNNSQFTALTFRGLMKLAFQRLLNRSK